MLQVVIDYNGVNVTRSEETILHDITFTVHSGEYVYLTGRVGAGKTTLLKTLYAQVPVVGGDAIVLDYNLMDIKRGDILQLRRQMGIVFQDFQLLMDRNVFDNLKFVLRATGWKNHDEIAERIEWALQQVGMTSKAYDMPHQLSGGEQQRIAIARALLNKPQLIIADEPTGNLDHITATGIMQLLQDIAKAGTAVVMATHNRLLIDEFPATELRCEDATIKKIATKA